MKPEHFDVAIIGTGFSGLGMAITLKKAGKNSFVILEKAGDVGGTWRDNSYPGCACDVQSHLYSFSFEPNPRWSRMFAPQQEIFDYLRHCARKYEILPHIRFNSAVTRAAFDEATSLWRVETEGGSFTARILVSGMGGLSRPAYPKIPGIETFRGKAFHSQQWDHGYDLTGKKVAVIGTGASAIQFVPKIAPKVARLELFQRTPPWIISKPDRSVTPVEQELFERLPATQKLFRSAIYMSLEARVLAFSVQPKLMKLAQHLAIRHIRNQIADPKLRQTVTPHYTLGCKRVLISDDYYPALTLGNVSVVTSDISSIGPDYVETDDGVRHKVDAIIYGTGFHATDPVPAGMLFGRHGQDIVHEWRNGAEAFKGTTITGFPNLFVLMGPNTGLGHSSMVYMIESQIRYVMGALAEMERKKLPWIDVRKDVQEKYNRKIQFQLKDAIWSSGGCNSWYLDPRTGKNVTLWPSYTWKFRLVTRNFSLRDYQVGKAVNAPARLRLIQERS
jgi:cation diffusion facilitator CzcD-associated flavoprotein CzcO